MAVTETYHRSTEDQTCIDQNLVKFQKYSNDYANREVYGIKEILAKAVVTAAVSLPELQPLETEMRRNTTWASPTPMNTGGKSPQ